MIFVDSNIPMYLVGAPHPHKTDAQLLVEKSVAAGERMVTDAEVLQEILHRYAAIRRQDAIDPAINALLGFVDEIYPVELEDVLRAKALMLGHAELPARDALHLAIMDRRLIPRIMSFDTHFDRFPQVTRVSVP